MHDIMVPVSPGELIDKLTILTLKAERIADPAKRANVAHELAMLQGVAENLPARADLASLREELQAINTELWETEDAIRACEGAGDFGERFVELARSVYRLNDRRAEVKKRINLVLGSEIVEEKSYTDYGSAGGSSPNAISGR